MKRILSLLVAMVMTLGCVGITAMAEETASVVAKIGTTEYTDFDAAITAANAMTGDVTVEIYGAVEFTNGMELKGNYTSITFVGKGDDAKITINQSAGGDYLEAHGKTVAFADLTLAKANPAWANNSGHMGNYFSVQGGTVTYTNCTFPNGACTSTGTATYTNCTFENTSEYGLWVYDDALVTVNGGTIDSTKGIKVYSEDETSVTSTLTVQNATFTENVTAKPAVAIGYAESITLIGNTYNNTTGVLELDSGSDADCEGVTFVAQDANGNDIASTLTAVDRSNSSAACGVLVDGKIYTTVTEAAKEVETGDTVTLLHDSTEIVTLPEGVTLNTNDYTADGVTVAAPANTIKTMAELVEAVKTANSTITVGAVLTVAEGETYDLDLNGCTVNMGAYYIENNGTLTIKNGTVIADTFNETTNGAPLYNHGGTLTIVNGTYTGVIVALRVHGGDVTIEDGTFNVTKADGESSNHVIRRKDGNLTIKDGIFNGNNSNNGGEGCTIMSATDNGTTEIIGGTFNDFAGGPDSIFGEGVGVTVKGGTFNFGNNTEGFTYQQCLAGYLAEGYEVDENGVVGKIVAKIGEIGYTTVADAFAAAVDGDTITLIWAEGDAPIAMNGAVYGNKTVTITGTATVDWSKGNLFVGRGGEGNGKVIFDNANLTSASNSSAYGIHVSGREKNTTDKYDGTVIIQNSTIELDYLINKGTMTLDSSTLTVKNGFSIGGRPASETESGEDATATLTLNNNSKVIVNNHNGMGLGYEAIGVMNVNTGSTFECTQDFLITAKGTMNIKGGNLIVDGTLTTNKNLFISGDSVVKIENLSGRATVLDDTTLTDSYIKSTANGTTRVLGDLTLNGGFNAAYLMTAGSTTSTTGYEGTITIEDNTTVNVSYGVDMNGNVTLNGGTIDLSGGDASGAIWGCVFQNGTFEINSDIVVDGGSDATPIHFTKATATVNGNITQSKTGGEPIYVNAGSTVTFGDDAVITTDCSVYVSGTLKSNGDVYGTITKASDTAVIEISGGTYTQDVSDWCVDGYTCEQNVDGTWGIVEAAPELPTGTVTCGYAENYKGFGRIWGQATGNAQESVKLELYSEGKLIATTLLNDRAEGDVTLIDGNIEELTWSFLMDQSQDAWWTTTWEAGHPNELAQPDKVVLYIDGVKVDEDVVKMTSPDDLHPITWKELVGVKEAVLPNAEVKELGNITVTDDNGDGDYSFGTSYYVYDLANQKLDGTSSEAFDLNVAMQFIAKDTEEEAKANAYANYTTDFFIKIDGLSTDSFVGNDCYLAGYYPSYNAWVKIPLNGLTIENGKTYPVISLVGWDFKYVDICTDVKEFTCGIYLSEKVITENPGINVNLALGLAENLEAAQGASFTTVGAYTYDAEDFKEEEVDETAIFGTPFYMIDLPMVDGQYQVNLYSGIDSLKYKEVGFKVYDKNENLLGQSSTNTVYTSIKGSNMTIVASEFNMFRIFGVEVFFGTAWDNTEIYFRPYAKDLNDKEILGKKYPITDIYTK